MGNTPINGVDPDGGFFPFGTVIGAIAGGLTAAIAGDNVWAGIGTGAAAGALVDLTIYTLGTGPLAIAAASAVGAGATYGDSLLSDVINDRKPDHTRGAISASVGLLLPVAGKYVGRLAKPIGNSLSLGYKAIAQNFGNKIAGELAEESAPMILKSVGAAARNSITTKKFWKSFNKLPEKIKTQAKSQYGVFKNNPGHPSLEYEVLKGFGKRQIVSVRVTSAYRAYGEVINGVVHWSHIDKHNYNLLKNIFK